MWLVKNDITGMYLKLYVKDGLEFYEWEKDPRQASQFTSEAHASEYTTSKQAQGAYRSHHITCVSVVEKESEYALYDSLHPAQP